MNIQASVYILLACVLGAALSADRYTHCTNYAEYNTLVNLIQHDECMNVDSVFKLLVDMTNKDHSGTCRIHVINQLSGHFGSHASTPDYCRCQGANRLQQYHFGSGDGVTEQRTHCLNSDPDYRHLYYEFFESSQPHDIPACRTHHSLWSMLQKTDQRTIYNSNSNSCQKDIVFHLKYAFEHHTDKCSCSNNSVSVPTNGHQGHQTDDKCHHLDSFNKLQQLGDSDGCLSANSVWHYLDDLQVQSPECRARIQKHLADKYQHTSQDGNGCVCTERKPLVNHEVHRISLIANSMDPDETAQMRRLIWIHAGRKRTMLVFRDAAQRFNNTLHRHEDLKIAMTFDHLFCADLESSPFGQYLRNNGSYSSCRGERGTYLHILFKLFDNIRAAGCQNHNFLWSQLQGIHNHCTQTYNNRCTRYVDCTQDLIVRAAIQYPHDTSDSCVCSTVSTTTKQTTPTSAATTQKTLAPASATPASTTMVTTQPMVPTINFSCNKLSAVEDIAKSLHATHPDSSPCDPNAQGSDDAFVLSVCNTAAPATWRKGANVMADCESSTQRIPTYTPISTFNGDTYNPLGAQSGIFLGCYNNGIKMAIQKCNGVPEIIHVESGAFADNPRNYFVIV